MLEDGGDFVPFVSQRFSVLPQPYVSFIALFSFDPVYSPFTFLELLASHLRLFNDSHRLRDFFLYSPERQLILGTINERACFSMGKQMSKEIYVQQQ